MSVGKQNFLRGGLQRVFQKDSFVEFQIGQKRLPLRVWIAAAAVWIGIAAFGGIVHISFYQVMIAVEEVEAPLSVKKGKDVVDCAVGLNDLLQIRVFPQFIPVPKLDIGIVRSEIMLQGGQIEGLILQKIVIGGTCSPVTVTEQYIFCPRVKRESQGSLQTFFKTPVAGHTNFLIRSILRNATGR